MKLKNVITIGLITVLVLALSATFILAQDSNDPTPPAYGPGSMWGSDNSGYGMSETARGISAEECRTIVPVSGSR